LLDKADFDKGGNSSTGYQERPVEKQNLSDFGLNKKQSSEFQKINWFQEKYPKEFEQTILKEKELTTAKMLVVAKDYEKIEKSF